MANPPDAPSFIPQPRQDVFSTSLALDQETVDWLDGLAERLNRSRSEIAREIFKRVRESEPKDAA
jgi:predicted transcriptional regulator